MPLDKSPTRAAIGRNIATEKERGKPKKQAIAIALNTARNAGMDIPQQPESRQSGVPKPSGQPKNAPKSSKTKPKPKAKGNAMPPKGER